MGMTAQWKDGTRERLDKQQQNELLPKVHIQIAFVSVFRSLFPFPSLNKTSKIPPKQPNELPFIVNYFFEEKLYLCQVHEVEMNLQIFE